MHEDLGVAEAVGGDEGRQRGGGACEGVAARKGAGTGVVAAGDKGQQGGGLREVVGVAGLGGVAGLLAWKKEVVYYVFGGQNKVSRNFMRKHEKLRRNCHQHPLGAIA